MSSQPKSAQRYIHSLADMQTFATEVAHEIMSAQASGRVRRLILLDGVMGAGKTQFTKFFVEALGSNEAVSPSFAIHNSYAAHSGLSIEHFDLYRLEAEDDLESTGFWDFFGATSGIVIVEWASRLKEMGLASQLPRTWPRLEIEFLKSGDSDERGARVLRV